MGSAKTSDLMATAAGSTTDAGSADSASARVASVARADDDAARRSADRQRDRWTTGGIAGLTLAVYVWSLMPGIGFSGDAAKWQMLSAVGGIPHATGYPLYVVLIQAFGWVMPFGSAAWRTNLFSALCAAAAVALLFQLLRALAVRRSVAAATALTFAFTRTFWSQAVIAEVYTLHILFLVSILYCLARWRSGGRNAYLMAGVALLTLSFGNHLSTVLALPAVAWLVWSDRRRAVTLRNGLWAGVCAALGASQYLYLLYASEVGGYVEFQVNTLGDIGSIVTGGPFKNQMFVFTLTQLISDRVPLLWDFMRHEYLVLLAPIAVGLWSGLRGPRGPEGRARRDVAISVALLGLGSAIYGLNFDVIDVVVFFLPLFLALAVYLGIGLDVSVAWITDRVAAHDADSAVESRGALRPSRHRLNRLASLSIAGALVAMPLVTGLGDYRLSSQRGTTTDAQRIELALDNVGDHAVLLTDNYDDSEYLWYYLIGEGLAESRHLALVHQATPEMVRSYFATNEGPVADAVARAAIDDPSGQPALYTASPDQPDALTAAGFEVTEVAAGLWRIDREQSRRN